MSLPGSEYNANEQGRTATLDGLDETASTAVSSEPSRLQRLLHFEIAKQRVKRKDLMHFSRQLAVFVKAGIPILDALESLTAEAANKRFREVLINISDRLREGSTFAGAIASHNDVFPAFYVGMIEAAELTGHLDSALNQLSYYIERDLEARRRLTSALTYPAIVMVMAVVVVVVLSVYVLPKFETFFASLDAKLPLPTRMLLNTSRFFHHWWYVIVGVLLLAIIAGLAARATSRGRAFLDRVSLRIPALGDVLNYAILERFCRVLSSMIQAGVPLPQALAVTTDAAHNAVYREGLASAREAMLRGEGLAGPLAATGLFPSAARQMFRVGEDTGSLDEQLVTAADYFDRELDYKLKRFASLFEPAVIIFVGVVVGFVAVALVSAMYGIFRSANV
jgi:type IV pilus assembly protein PilC